MELSGPGEPDGGAGIGGGAGADESLDEVFKALADPSRRLLLDALRADGGQTLRELCGGLAMARQSVSKHLAVLERANLVAIVWRGREKLHYLNAAPIDEISERWISRYHRGRVEALADLKHALEGTPMPTPDFVYTTYIRTTPRLLWQALTEPAFTRRYWFGMTFESTWEVGAAIRVTFADGTVSDDPGQVVTESDPYRRLAYTWFEPQCHDTDGGADGGADGRDGDGVGAGAEPERRSTVSFDLEEVDGQVRLTVVHDGFAPGSPTLTSISNGWPRVLSDLKTLLEAPEGAS